MDEADLQAILARNPDISVDAPTKPRPKRKGRNEWDKSIDPETGERKQHKKKKPSPLERTFDLLWQDLDGPELEADYIFHQARDWKIDRAHLSSRIAIEIDGGTWKGGRHNREPGYTNDCIKLFNAVLAGWQYFRLTGDMLKQHEKYLPFIKQMILEDTN